MSTIIPATTDAVSGPSTVIRLMDEKVLLIASNLAGAEEVDVLALLSGGITKPWLNSAGAAVKMTATEYMVGIQGPGVITLTKDATAGACAVEFFRNPR